MNAITMDCTSPASLSSEAGYSSFLTSSIKSADDLILIQYTDPATNAEKTNILFVSEDDEVFFGRSPKVQAQMTLDDYIKALRPIPDAALFPEVPKDVSLTIAADDDESPSFCKQPGLFQYEPEQNTGTPKLVLDETLIMETLAKNPHPNIIHYKGCRVRRGRITGIILAEHEETLEQFLLNPEHQHDSLDQEMFLAALDSAVKHLHSLGLAHNDINPGNIMINGSHMPVLIDFGSCQPFGKKLQTFGTPGWIEEEFWTSEKKHDIFGLGKLRQWMKEMISKRLTSPEHQARESHV
jgi:serine/threonine protein kinase